MLKIRCSSCNESIASPLLAEIEKITCGHCRQVVPVSDVVVSSQGFNIHREDLLKRFFRYQKLLTEVIQEQELMQDSPAISPESRKSVDRFIATLEELMDGARNNFRLHFSQPPAVHFTVDQQLRTGKLVNLSIEGVCIEPEGGEVLPKVRSHLTLEFTLPGREPTLSLSGVVIWAKRRSRTQAVRHGIGVRFKGLTDSVRSELWQYIVDHVEQAETGEGRK